MLVSHGFSRIHLNSAIEDSGLIPGAEQKLRLLVKYFCKYSKEVGTFPALSNTHFNNALNECPVLWPFHS